MLRSANSLELMICNSNKLLGQEMTAPGCLGNFSMKMRNCGCGKLSHASTSAILAMTTQPTAGTAHATAIMAIIRPYIESVSDTI